MPAYVNPVDFLKIGIMAFIFVWGFNAALRKGGMNSFTTSGQ